MNPFDSDDDEENDDGASDELQEQAKEGVAVKPSSPSTPTPAPRSSISKTSPSKSSHEIANGSIRESRVTSPVEEDHNDQKNEPDPSSPNEVRYVNY